MYNSVYRKVLLMVFVVVLTFTIIPENRINASVVSKLKTEIEERNKQVKHIERDIKVYKGEIQRLGKESTTLENTIQILDVNRRKVSSNISLTENKVTNTELSIEKLEIEILEKNLEIKNNLRIISETLQQVDEAEGQSLLEIILTHDNISEFWEDLENLQSFQIGIKSALFDLRDLKKEAEIQKENEIVEKKNLLGYQGDLFDQKSLLDITKNEKKVLLKDTKNEETNYQKLLVEKEKAKQSFENELLELESKLEIALDPSKIPTSGAKAIRWPIDGEIRLTQKFGKTSDSGRLYASGTHNGIDIGIPRGTPIKAASDGIIIGVGDTDKTCKWASYGKWILVQHNNGLSTLYAHLDLIKVNEGQRVDEGQLIGYSGNTGYSTGPHLHFTVFASEGVKVGNLESRSCSGAQYRLPLAPKNAYLDPESYL